MDVAVRAARLIEEFRRRYHRDPEGVWAAPGRVNLIGEHTDYNGGLALPFAIDRQVLVAAEVRRDGGLRCWSMQRADDSRWTAYPRGVRSAAIEEGRLPDDAGADLAVDSDVPIGAGLSSSAALGVAVALALLDLFDVTGVARLDVARLCQRAENSYIGAPTGLLDQIAVLFGRAGTARLIDFRDLSSRDLSGRDLPLRLDGLRLQVIDTRVQHDVGEGGYADRRAACERAAAALGLPTLREATLAEVVDLPEPLRRRARHVVTENERVREVVRLLGAAQPAPVGPVLDASHASLRDDYEVSCPELDLAVRAARDSGALGARMTGAGFGGSAVALVPADGVGDVAAAVTAAFRSRGWAAPGIFTVEPGPGAQRLPVP
jgi:galactokinase